MRETKARTQALADHIHSETLHAKLCGRRWRTHIQEGSPTNGLAWRIALVCPKTGAHHAHPAVGAGGDYLGWTRAEANMQLSRILRGVQFVNMSKKLARSRYGRYS